MLGGAGNYVMLGDADGMKPKLLLQAVPEAKAVKNRMHRFETLLDTLGVVQRGCCPHC
jgi:hypothetical protein